MQSQAGFLVDYECTKISTNKRLHSFCTHGFYTIDCYKVVLLRLWMMNLLFLCRLDCRFNLDAVSLILLKILSLFNNITSIYKFDMCRSYKILRVLLCSLLSMVHALKRCNYHKQSILTHKFHKF